MIDKGHVFIWCHEALAYEVVPHTLEPYFHAEEGVAARGDLSSS